MRAQLIDYLSGEVVAALRAAGYDIVKIGEPPPWMARVPSLPRPLYVIVEGEEC
jgi:hypothetical protein